MVRRAYVLQISINHTYAVLTGVGSSLSCPGILPDSSQAVTKRKYILVGRGAVLS